MSELNNLCPGCFEYKGDSKQCPSCGFDEGRHRTGFFLPFRTVLDGKYLIGRELGAGGFGITYLGFDTVLQCRAAIKEFFPRELVGRKTGSTTLVPFSGEAGEFFEYGLRQFLKEARTMAKFDHPNIVRVRNFFGQNNTAYIAMDYYEGHSLDESIKNKGGRFSEDGAMEIILPILDGLENIHKKNYLHRDIKPQNILITPAGKPILIDFGAARYVTGRKSQNLTVVLTPGFAPFEQYQNRGRQGAWTDIYSLCAAFYYMLSGEVPPFAPERTDDDDLIPLEQISPDVSPGVCKAIMQGLELRIDNRPQTVDEFRNLLGKGPQPPPPPPPGKKIKIFSLMCLSGDYKDSSIELSHTPIAIGRDPKKVNLFIYHQEVSRVHAQAWPDEEGKGVWVADCESLNGTFRLVRGHGSEEEQWIEIKGKKLLKPGERFRLGTDGDEFEIGVESVNEKEARDQEEEKYSIVRCPSCGAKNRIILDRPLEQAKCGECGASFESIRQETDEHDKIEPKGSPIDQIDGRRDNGVKGWVIALAAALAAAAIIIAYFLLRS